MKIFCAISFIIVSLVGCSWMSGSGMPKITEFWLKYGPEETDPQTYRCMIKVIDMAARKENEATLRKVRIFLFEQTPDRKIGEWEEDIILPFNVDVSAVWKTNEVEIIITERDKEDTLMSRSLRY